VLGVGIRAFALVEKEQSVSTRRNIVKMSKNSFAVVSGNDVIDFMLEAGNSILESELIQLIVSFKGCMLSSGKSGTSKLRNSDVLSRIPVVLLNVLQNTLHARMWISAQMSGFGNGLTVHRSMYRCMYVCTELSLSWYATSSMLRV